eukprot:GFYU01000511.1.p1 GENE.GFYU01000511.1~~GFYU01000511.1.p1  ORF type:complete len:409 (+),score=54.19 GFYU01000511.1:84-1310(+)
MGQTESAEGICLGVGLPGSGKTALLYATKLGEYCPTIPGIGFCVETVDVQGLTLTMHTVGLEKSMKMLWRHYYHSLDCLLFFVDSTDPSNFDVAMTELHQIVTEIVELRPQLTVCVAATKHDVPGAAKADVIRDALGVNEIEKMLGGRYVLVQECSAVTQQGLKDVMTFIYDSVMLVRGPSSVWRNPRAWLKYRWNNRLTSRETQKSTTDEAYSAYRTLLQERFPGMLDESIITDISLVQAFEQRLLPLQVWDHRNRIRIVWSYLADTKYSTLEDSKQSLLSYWKAYKDEIGHDMYFHMTLTCFWVHMVLEAMRRITRPHQLKNVDDDIDETDIKAPAHFTLQEEGYYKWNNITFAQFYEQSPHLHQGSAFDAYYTRDRLLGPDNVHIARSEVIEPDLQPLPSTSLNI